MSSNDAWRRYVDAMRRHLAHNERLADRLRYYVGDGAAAPVDLAPGEAAAWLGLVKDGERLAREHREALETLLSSLDTQPR